MLDADDLMVIAQELQREIVRVLDVHPHGCFAELLVQNPSGRVELDRRVVVIQARDHRFLGLVEQSVDEVALCLGNRRGLAPAVGAGPAPGSLVPLGKLRAHTRTALALRDLREYWKANAADSQTFQIAPAMTSHPSITW